MYALVPIFQISCNIHDNFVTRIHFLDGFYLRFKMTSEQKWKCLRRQLYINWENPHIPRIDDDVTSFQIFLLIFGPFLGHTLLQGRREWNIRKVLFIPEYQSNISIRSQEWTVYWPTLINSSFMAGHLIGSLSNNDGDGYLRKRHLKSEVALLQTLSRLFHLV